MNRLGRERSPYLLQHAANPVDWFPWSDEAFEKARAEDRPIFLSIGYSTCHWCHVMERESFENPAVAAVLNDHFVSIKVDREERPDVDRVYMTFVQATTGSGGWPMSVWLTPDLKPFYGGTYFPPDSRWGRPGFVDLLHQITHAWEADRAKVLASATSITEQLRAAGPALRSSGNPASGIPGPEALAGTVHQFRLVFDARHGGFGESPKFPRPSELFFLMREHARTGDVDARDMALTTLTAMARGGIRDHVGGGFHRYSVDAAWRVPHFEKMLYDQAQLALAYAEGAQLSGERFFMDVAEDTLRYVLREMTDDLGGFYSAEDADSVPPEEAGREGAHRAEGAFYLWTERELDVLLGGDSAIVKPYFGIRPAGNAPLDPQQEFRGKNLLYVATTEAVLGETLSLPRDEISDTLNRARLAMFKARLSRPRPHLDDKVLTAWNGLMIAALARVARVLAAFDDTSDGARLAYLDAARRAASFLHTHMWKAGSRTLLRRFRDGHAEIDAYAEDYACVVFGMLELFQADPDRRWLEWSLQLQRRQDELFWDEVEGGWFSTTGGDPAVILRLKEDYDGAEPTASAVAVWNLLTLAHLVDEPIWTERVERTLSLFAPRLEQTGRAVPMMASGLSAHVAGMRQIVVVEGPGADALERVVASNYLPFTTTLRPTLEQRRLLSDVAPWLAAMQPVDDRATAYVCQEFACQPPVTDAPSLERLIRGTNQT